MDFKQHKIIYLFAFCVSGVTFLLGILFYCFASSQLSIPASILVSLGGSILSASVLGFFLELSESRTFEKRLKLKAEKIIRDLEERITAVLRALIKTYSYSLNRIEQMSALEAINYINALAVRGKLIINKNSKKTNDSFRQMASANYIIINDYFVKFMTLYEDHRDILSGYVLEENLQKVAELVLRQRNIQDDEIYKFIYRVGEISKAIASRFKFIKKFEEINANEFIENVK